MKSMGKSQQLSALFGGEIAGLTGIREDPS